MSPAWRLVVLCALAGWLCLAPRPAPAKAKAPPATDSCSRRCADQLKGADGCCARLDLAQQRRRCPFGQARTLDTDGHCCWPGQIWSRDRWTCTGTPTECPVGAVATADEGCRWVPCPTGQVRTQGGQACCWPAQEWSDVRGACAGTPACPEGFEASGEACVGGTAMLWIPVPGGTFRMGNDQGAADEKPAHTVRVRAFSVTRSEITVAQYRACVRAGACSAPSLVHAPSQERGGYYNWGADGRIAHPINGVSWGESQVFCEWAGGSLPTEAQWEYLASGAGAGHAYAWGDEPPSCERAIIREVGGDISSDGCGRDQTWPVCSKPAGHSVHGLCDVTGNVWEWIADYYADDYYSRSPRRDPTGPDTGTSRVYRGASWASNKRDRYRVTYRGSSAPDDPHFTVGFRCVRR